MTVPRLASIVLMFFVAALAWVILGTSVQVRTGMQDQALRNEVGGLWGEPQTQHPPAFTAWLPLRDKGRGSRRTQSAHAVVSQPMEIAASDVRAVFDLDQRKKGLLWYATYAVDLDARYRVLNPRNKRVAVRMDFRFPVDDAVYDGFRVTVDGREIPVRYVGGSAAARFTVPAKGRAEVRLGYRTQGLDSWKYAPTERIDAVKDFRMIMDTDFADVDFPDGAVSPTSKRRTASGWRLEWRYDSLVSGRPIALRMPQPLNPGPISARISLFAPVSLLFFFAALVLNTATAKVRVHPVNFAFLASGFFAFHLLFAYLVDHVDINLAFAVSSLVSLGLCVGYLRLVVGPGRTLVESALGQLLFLILFSYSFFFEGYTGLAIAVGAVATLAFYMLKTARVDWAEAFSARPPTS